MEPGSALTAYSLGRLSSRADSSQGSPAMLCKISMFINAVFITVHHGSSQLHCMQGYRLVSALASVV